MSRNSLMTWGILLVLVGIQLNLVESFVLTPKATEVWNSRLIRNSVETVPGNYVETSNGYFRGSNRATQLANQSFPNQSYGNTASGYQYSIPTYRGYNSSVPVYQSSYGRNTVAGQYGGPQKMLTPPSWLCWPPIFLGSVLFLYGAASRE